MSPPSAASAAAASRPFKATRASPRATSSRPSRASGAMLVFSSSSPRSTTCLSSSWSSCSSRKTRLRDRSGEMTSKEGFSVVAPIMVTVPSSTWGRIASCWALLKRWISSMNRTVRSPARRWSLASATTLRRSATPAVTADIATILALVSVASRPARVVLPLPGGPHRMMLGRLPDLVRRRRTSTTSRWPTRSSNFFGRRRVASGAWGSEPAGVGNSSPWSIQPNSELDTLSQAPRLEFAGRVHLLVLQLRGA